LKKLNSVSQKTTDFEIKNVFIYEETAHLVTDINLQTIWHESSNTQEQSLSIIRSPFTLSGKRTICSKIDV
jgi:hypothetical protein